MRDYLLNHWTGQLGFGVTLFVNLIGLSFLISLFTIDNLPDWAAVITVLILCLILIWQLLGGWRCANRLQTEEVANNSVLGIYAGLSVAIIMVGFQVLDIVSDRLFVEPPAKTIFGDDDFTAELIGDTIHLGGEINYLMYQAILIILSEQDDIKAVSLNSHGGIVFAARSIGKLIDERGLATRINDRCYSACTLVFAAGTERTVSTEADIGFHGYSFDMPYRFQSVDPIEEQEKDKAYLLTRGIQAAFLDKAFSTDARNLWTPSMDELMASGFITK